MCLYGVEIMIYQGSKAQWAPLIWDFIIRALQAHKIPYPDEKTYFVDAMCGGCGMTAYVPLKNRIANDINGAIVAYHQRIVEDTKWLLEPDLLLVTKERYYDIKDNVDRYSPAYRGFVGINYSWGAGFFAGYKPNGTLQEVAKRAYKSAVKESKKLKGVLFHNKDYRELYYPPHSIIYFDMPYRGTQGYKDETGKTIAFDYDAFFDFIEHLYNEGHYVFFSEYDPELPEWAIRIGSFERPSKFGRKKESVLVLPEGNNNITE